MNRREYNTELAERRQGGEGEQGLRQGRAVGSWVAEAAK